jgi:hypothetical protein
VIIVVVACVLNMSFIGVAVLVAVVTTHPTVIVDVAVATAVPDETVRVDPVTPLPPTVKFPVISVVLAAVFLMVSPLRSVSWVVLAPPRNVARPVMPSVVENVPEVPVKPPVVCSAPDMTVELAEAFLIVSLLPSVSWVVLAPPRNRATVPAGVVNVPLTAIVVLALPPKVETPVAPSVPLVKILVLMVVAACAMPALTKTTARERTATRTPLPRLFR